MTDVSEILKKPVNRLRSKVNRGAVGNVDREGGDNGAGLISGFSVITRGEALGHYMWCDGEFLQQVHDAINEAGGAGLKARFTHPGLSADGLGKFLGNIKNASMKGDQVIADLHFSKSAHKTPDGNLAGYVMDFADEDPDKFGSSIVFMPDRKSQELFYVEHKNEDSGDFESPDPDNKKNYEHCRLSKLYGADIVDDPAANPDGLFHRGQDIPQQAEELLNYAFHIEGADKPSQFDFGIDPDRLSAYLDRYLDNHGLIIVTKGELEEMANETETPSKPEVNIDEIRSQYTAELNKYVSKFGAENGVKWLGEGKSYSSALEAHVDVLGGQLAAKDKQIEELNEKIASIDLGEDTPLESGQAGEKKGGGKGAKGKYDAFQALHRFK
tara:strand:- start:2339 stop:3490 length:1152 start_codon:yes stop_codon:yes gene_type:complete